MKETYEKAEQLQLLMEQIATGIANADDEGERFKQLRLELMQVEEIQPFLPDLVLKSRTSQLFRTYLKGKFKTYGKRRRYIEEQFAPLFKHLEQRILAEKRLENQRAKRQVQAQEKPAEAVLRTPMTPPNSTPISNKNETEMPLNQNYPLLETLMKWVPKSWQPYVAVLLLALSGVYVAKPSKTAEESAPTPKSACTQYLLKGTLVGTKTAKVKKVSLERGNTLREDETINDGVFILEHVELPASKLLTLKITFADPKEPPIFEDVDVAPLLVAGRCEVDLGNRVVR